MRKLIINADDFGFNREITDGIVQCHRIGNLTSTTMMVNMPAAEYAVEQSGDNPKLSVGIHLNLTIGKPVSDPKEVPDLVDEDGYFLAYGQMLRRANRFKLNAGQVEREFRAQIERFFSLGVRPTHCDSHHHISACMQTFPIQIKLLKEYGIERIRTHRGIYHYDKKADDKLKVIGRAVKTNLRKLPNRVYYEFQHIYCKVRGFKMPDERYGLAKLISTKPLEPTIDDFRKFAENCPRGVVEFVVHPGLMSADPLDRPEYRAYRVKEFELLTNPLFKEACDQANIRLINFLEF